MSESGWSQKAAQLKQHRVQLEGQIADLNNQMNPTKQEIERLGKQIEPIQKNAWALGKELEQLEEELKIAEAEVDFENTVKVGSTVYIEYNTMYREWQWIQPSRLEKRREHGKPRPTTIINISGDQVTVIDNATKQEYIGYVKHTQKTWQGVVPISPEIKFYKQ